MNLDGQRANRVLVISLVVILIFSSSPSNGWQKTLTFVQQSSYELSKNKQIVFDL